MLSVISSAHNMNTYLYICYIIAWWHSNMHMHSYRDFVIAFIARCISTRLQPNGMRELAKLYYLIIVKMVTKITYRYLYFKIPKNTKYAVATGLARNQIFSRALYVTIIMIVYPLKELTIHLIFSHISFY